MMTRFCGIDGVSSHEIERFGPLRNALSPHLEVKRGNLILDLQEAFLLPFYDPPSYWTDAKVSYSTAIPEHHPEGVILEIEKKVDVAAIAVEFADNVGPLRNRLDEVSLLPPAIQIRLKCAPSLRCAVIWTRVGTVVWAPKAFHTIIEELKERNGEKILTLSEIIKVTNPPQPPE